MPSEKFSAGFEFPPDFGYQLIVTDSKPLARVISIDEDPKGLEYGCKVTAELLVPKEEFRKICDGLNSKPVQHDDSSISDFTDFCHAMLNDKKLSESEANTIQTWLNNFYAYVDRDEVP